MNEQREQQSSASDPGHWRGGWLGLHVNEHDRRLWVPKKRLGIGWTLNLGHRRARAVIAAPVAMVIAGALAAMLLDAG